MKEKLTNSMIKTLLKLFRALINRWKNQPAATSKCLPTEPWNNDRAALALIAVDILVTLTRILIDRAESGMADMNNTSNTF